MVNWVMILVFSFMGVFVLSILIVLWVFIRRAKKIRVCIINNGQKKTRFVNGGSPEIEVSGKLYFIKKDKIIRKGMTREIYFMDGNSYPINFDDNQKPEDYNAEEIKDITKTKIIRDILRGDEDIKIMVFFIITWVLMSIAIIVSVVVK